MNFHLIRDRTSLYGIFGSFYDEQNNIVAMTLEHAYSEGAAFVPKLASGTYTCVRHLPNKLHYVTFMVTGVPDFQGNKVDGILIHIGNYNNDSEGCILLGESATATCILGSRDAFNSFMAIQEGLDEFILIVS